MTVSTDHWLATNSFVSHFPSQVLSPLVNSESYLTTVFQGYRLNSWLKMCLCWCLPQHLPDFVVWAPEYSAAYLHLAWHFDSARCIYLNSSDLLSYSRSWDYHRTNDTLHIPRNRKVKEHKSVLSHCEKVLEVAQKLIKDGSEMFVWYSSDSSSVTWTTMQVQSVCMRAYSCPRAVRSR